MIKVLTIKKVWILLLSLPFFISCATYNNKLSAYYGEIRNGNYLQAEKLLSSNKFLKANRNELLLYLEKGKLYHLLNQYDSSNLYFNLADKYWEDHFKNAVDAVKATLINPMTQKYVGEDFEPFLMHYYKALNYLYLNKPNEAVVEARRITLSSNFLNNKTNSNTKYKADAFALNLQGMLYQVVGDNNNAFIAYRNATEIYLNNNGNYYGTAIPKQLQQDLLQTATAMGFTDQVNKYQQLFKTTFTPLNSSNGEVIIFIEQGFAPIKQEQNFTLVNGLNEGSYFNYTDPYGISTNLSFNAGYYNTLSNNNVDIKNIRTLRIAMPTYIVGYAQKAIPQAITNNKTYTAELAENINTIAVATLKERLPFDLVNAVVRQVAKLAIEKGTAAATTAIANNNSKEKDEKKKKQNAETAGAVAGLLVNILNNATEKADTRNWQSIPAFISYVRVPLQQGKNTIILKYGSNTKTIQLNSSNTLQVINWNTTKQ